METHASQSVKREHGCDTQNKNEQPESQAGDGRFKLHRLVYQKIELQPRPEGLLLDDFQIGGSSLGEHG